MTYGKMLSGDIISRTEKIDQAKGFDQKKSVCTLHRDIRERMRGIIPYYQMEHGENVQPWIIDPMKGG